MMKIMLMGLIGLLLNVSTCKKGQQDFPAKKIEELKSKPVYNPPASVWQWDYEGVTYYYVTADCCDQYSELYDSEGTLICHPDGGYTGKGDGKCPFDISSSDTVNLKRTLIWRDDRKR